MKAETQIEIYRFGRYVNRVEDKKPAHVTMARLDKILSSVKIQDVAARMVEVTKRGNNYILNCPFCGAEKVMYISPKHQIYKCFRCGKTGNVINFVMEITGKSYEQALKYIETNFVIEK